MKETLQFLYDKGIELDLVAILTALDLVKGFFRHASLLPTTFNKRGKGSSLDNARRHVKERNDMRLKVGDQDETIYLLNRLFPESAMPQGKKVALINYVALMVNYLRLVVGPELLKRGKLPKTKVLEDSYFNVYYDFSLNTVVELPLNLKKVFDTYNRHLKWFLGLIDRVRANEPEPMQFMIEDEFWNDVSQDLEEELKSKSKELLQQLKSLKKHYGYGDSTSLKRMQLKWRNPDYSYSVSKDGTEQWLYDRISPDLTDKLHRIVARNNLQYERKPTLSIQMFGESIARALAPRRYRYSQRTLRNVINQVLKSFNDPRLSLNNSSRILDQLVIFYDKAL